MILLYTTLLLAAFALSSAGSIPQTDEASGMPSSLLIHDNNTVEVHVLDADGDLSLYDEKCPESNVFPGIEAGVSGYSFTEGDFYNDLYDPGFKNRIFKAYTKNVHGCFDPASGINVRPLKSCSTYVKSYSYESMDGYVKLSQSESSSSKTFQLGLDMSVKAEIPGTGIGISADIPPSFSHGSGNSNSHSDMKSFFQSTSGSAVSAHAECILHHMKLNSFISPPFDDTFGASVGVLYMAATQMDRYMQRSVFLAFLREYGTHYFTEMYFGARFSLTQKYGSSFTQKFGREKLSQCTTKTTSLSFFRKTQSTSCSESDESTISKYDGSRYAEIITTRGSAPPANGEDWASQKFTPEPLKFQLAPIINLFTDTSMMLQNVKTYDGRVVKAATLRKAYSPLYYNYCGPTCECFIPHCKECNVNDCRQCEYPFKGNKCDACEQGEKRIGNYCYSSHGGETERQKDRKTWEAAEADCQSRNGHLVYIQTKAKWDALADYLTALGTASPYYWIWVGARASPSGSDNWLWGSGESLAGLHGLGWNYRQGCGLLVRPGDRLPLSAARCSDPRPYVCEYGT